MSILISLNSSKLLIGFSTLLISIGSKYLFNDINDTEVREILSHPLMKQFIIFLILFLATRDIVISMCMSALLSLLVCTLFNKSSILYYPILFKGLHQLYRFNINAPRSITHEETISNIEDVNIQKSSIVGANDFWYL